MADELGNFIKSHHQIPCARKFSEDRPSAVEYGPEEHALIADLTERVARYQTAMGRRMEVRKSARRIARDLGRGATNTCRRRRLWTTFKKDLTASREVRLGH